MAINVRQISAAADLESWRQVRIEVVPYERAPTVAELMDAARPERLYFLADLAGQVAGSGLVDRSALGGTAVVTPRVLPSFRRLGVGTVLLRVLSEHAARLGFSALSATADDDGSLSFASRHGFHEVDREVEQVRVIGDEAEPAVPEGVVIVPVSTRPDLWPAAYHAVGLQAFQDVATVSPLQVTLEQWEREWITDPGAMFVALAGDEVIGCAGLLPDPDLPERAEQALTAVRRDWRHRGVARALKQTTLCWAARREITEVYTWTQRGNDDMRALNTGLGFSTRTEAVKLHADLPLPIR